MNSTLRYVLSLIILAFLAAVIAALGSGCSNPFKKYQKADQKVTRVEQKLATNHLDQVAIGRDFVYAADLSLSKDNNPSQEAVVAKEMTERSLLALGLPVNRDATKARDMVVGLLSTNEESRIKGEALLKDNDEALSDSQSERLKLSRKLESNEKKLEEVNSDNATLASKWARLVHIVYWILGVAGVVVVLWLALTIGPYFIPALAPFATGAKVAKETLSTLVGIIQKVRHHVVTPEVKADIDKELATMGQKNREVIADIKKELGLV